MKAFEDWARFPHDKGEWDLGYARGAEDGWRAALKWALTQETDIQSTEIAYHIKNELEVNRVK